jgi:hypothetical protein
MILFLQGQKVCSSRPLLLALSGHRLNTTHDFLGGTREERLKAQRVVYQEESQKERKVSKTKESLKNKGRVEG